MDPKKAKSSIVEQLKNAGSIVVTTNNSPSTDEISATIGLTHMLQTMKKHATAVVSSQPPESLKFLGTDQNLESSTDRMRDFVLSFDKEKADKFRYKLIEDQVKIFITPYKTVITKDDFHFTQGDFNIDVIIVIGAGKRQDLDQAILEHGRILHEAEVLTINAGKGPAPSIGSVNWIDPDATSVSEMLVSISEALGSDLLTEDSAQALLTGIIDNTEMFSSTVTSPKVMTMAAQLMAAGADQHKIIEQLKVPEPEPVSMPEDNPAEVAETSDESDSTDNDQQPPEPPKPKPEDGVSVDLSAMHQKQEAQQAAQPSPPQAQPDKPEAKPVQPPVPKPPEPPQAPQPTAQDSSAPHGGYLRGTGPSNNGANSINSAGQDSGNNKIFSHPSNPDDTGPTDKEVSDKPHINVHPQLPTMHKHDKTITPPPPPPPLPDPNSQTVQPSAPPATTQPQAPSPPPPPLPPAPLPKPQQPAPQPRTTNTGGNSGVDSARQAVEQAIASSPSPLPVARQDTSATPADQGGDIVIDHDGNIKR